MMPKLCDPNLFTASYHEVEGNVNYISGLEFWKTMTFENYV